MTTPTEMREWAATLERIAPKIDTPYGPGQVSTYGLAWEALRSAADEIERLQEAVTEPPEKWSFDTLMWAADRLLAEIYPPGIFTGVSGDPGPRLVVALRNCRAAMSVKDTENAEGGPLGSVSAPGDSDV